MGGVCVQWGVHARVATQCMMGCVCDELMSVSVHLWPVSVKTCGNMRGRLNVGGVRCAYCRIYKYTYNTLPHHAHDALVHMRNKHANTCVTLCVKRKSVIGVLGTEGPYTLSMRYKCAVGKSQKIA